MADKMNQAEAKGFKKVEWVAVKNLSVVWAEAQRPLNARHVQTISDNFDPEMFGALAVTLPNGNGIYHVIDGQHRKVAVEKLWGKDELVPCQIYEAEDPARAAELFDHINSGRRSLSGLEQFKVRVTAQKNLQVEVNKIIKKCGYHLGHHEKGSIWCVGALENIYQTCGPVVLEATLRLIRKMWGDENSAASAVIVRGVGIFLSEFRHINPDRMAAAVSAKYTPFRLIGAAKTGREMGGGNAPTVIRDILVSTYNKTVRGDKNKLRVGTKGSK